MAQTGNSSVLRIYYMLSTGLDVYINHQPCKLGDAVSSRFTDDPEAYTSCLTAHSTGLRRAWDLNPSPHWVSWDCVDRVPGHW